LVGGPDILVRQHAEGWGTKVIDRLAKDLQTEFPGVEGFSPRSLKYMRSFAEAWTEEPIVQQLAAQLPWGHHMVLLDRLKDQQTREWYLKAAVEHGWSRNVLVHHISTQLQERQGKALTNFSRTLPSEDSDLAEQILKDPYNFDFLTLASTTKERELERGLLTHLRDLLLELGRGFAFVGSQVPLEVGGRSFYIDLLFYHLRLHCYFVIELKAVECEPEHAGKLNFYISAVDEIMGTPSMAPHRAPALREQMRSGRRVRLAKHRSAHWCIHLSGDSSLLHNCGRVDVGWPAADHAYSGYRLGPPGTANRRLGVRRCRLHLGRARADCGSASCRSVGVKMVTA
jgi:predicted nuclease of restriction endonuclease-like (RecB) superfamily